MSARPTRSAGCWRAARSRAVDDVSLRLEAGKPEIFAIIGESGSGKTTLARMILNLATPTDGAIRFRGTDVTTIRRSRARMDFMRQVQPIFQNPFEAFNPLKRLDRYLFVTRAALRGRARRGEIEAAADEALRKVGLSLAEVQGPLSARAVRRPAAAHRDRARADLVARADRRRRAGLDGRRLAAHVDRQPVQGAARRAEASRSSTSRTTSRPPTTSATAC